MVGGVNRVPCAMFDRSAAFGWTRKYDFKPRNLAESPPGFLGRRGVDLPHRVPPVSPSREVVPKTHHREVEHLHTPISLILVDTERSKLVYFGLVLSWHVAPAAGPKSTDLTQPTLLLSA